MNEDTTKDASHWRQLLAPEQYRVTREKGTEPPFTGKFHNHKEEGTYNCVCCGKALFNSGTKFDSGTGWPSFYAPFSQEAIKTATDTSHGSVRTEVLCKNCSAHLGHVFDDGPKPTGQRYCINSLSLGFTPAEKQSEQNPDL